MHAALELMHVRPPTVEVTEAAFAERLQNNIGRPLLSLGEVVRGVRPSISMHLGFPKRGC